MNTHDIMNLTLSLSGFESIPADSRIYKSCDNISKILFGIDINKNDLENAKQNDFDLVISHHPPYMILDDGFIKVLERFQQMLENAGVEQSVAEQAVEENSLFWQYIIQKFTTGQTHQDVISDAEKIDIALMNIHLSCDEIGRQILQRVADNLGQEKLVADLINSYSQIPEIQNSDEKVRLVCGSLDNKMGKTAVMHGAGTNGGYAVANALFDAGINTVVYIHLFPFQQEQEDILQQESKGNLIVTGHYGSDSIGINPLIDKLEDDGIEVVCCNNLIRNFT